MIGYSRQDLEAGRIRWRDITPPEWTASDAEAIEELRQTGACQPFEKEYRHRDGHRVPVLIGAAVIDRRPLRWTSFVIDLTSRQRAEREQAELVASTQAARGPRPTTARSGCRSLMRAGALVAATRDRDELLDQIVRLVVPALAECCIVFLPTADGTLGASALGHIDPARAAQLAKLRPYRIAPTGPLLTQRAFTTGTTQLSRDATAEMPAWTRAEPDAMSVVQLMRPRSAISTPLLSERGPIGVISLYRTSGRPAFTEIDVAVVEELEPRSGGGLATPTPSPVSTRSPRRCSARCSRPRCPAVPEPDLAVRYLPATEGAAVGGDWYDAFPVAGGRIGLVIGDVSGHNIASASIMGQVRSMLRAYAIDDPDPAAALERTNAAVIRLLPDALATVVYAVLNPASGDLVYANAGHPPPVITSLDGPPEYLDDAPGTVFSPSPAGRFGFGWRRLAAGARLLCYTDGLIEHRGRDIGDGLAALAEAIKGLPRVGRGNLRHRRNRARRRPAGRRLPAGCAANRPVTQLTHR